MGLTEQLWDRMEAVARRLDSLDAEFSAGQRREIDVYGLNADDYSEIFFPADPR